MTDFSKKIKNEKIKNILIEARSLLSKPKGWTQRTYARTSPTSPWHVPFDSPNAKCFCALGALMRACGGSYATGNNIENYHSARSILNESSYVLTNEDIMSYNDKSETKLEDVLKVYDHAIERLTT